MDFLIDGQFVTISQELVLIFDKNTYAWFAMAEGAVEKERERERERERGHYPIEQNFDREKFRDFFEILSLFRYEIFFGFRKILI